MNKPKRWAVQPQPDGAQVGDATDMNALVLAMSQTLSKTGLTELAAELLRATGYRPQQNWRLPMKKFSSLLLLALRSRSRIVLIPALLYILIAGLVGWLMPPYPRTTLKPPDKCGFMLFSPDGRNLMTADIKGVRGENRVKIGPIRVWDVDGGVERFAIASDWDRIDPSPNGKVFAAHRLRPFGEASLGSDLKVWNAETGEEIACIKPRSKAPFRGRLFQFSPDGKFLAFSEDWRSPSGFGIRLWEIEGRSNRGLLDGIEGSLVFSTDGTKAVTRSIKADDKRGFIYSRIMLWNIDKQGDVSLIAKSQITEASPAFSPALDTMALGKGGDPLQIELWDVPSFAKRCSFSCGPFRYGTLRFTPNGRMLAVSSWLPETPTTGLTLWDITASPRKIGEFSFYSVISPNGQWLANPNASGVTLFNVDTQQEHGALANSSGHLVFPSPSSSITPTIAFSPDSRLVAVRDLAFTGEPHPLSRWLPEQFNLFASNKPPLVGLWDVESLQVLATLGNCKQVAFSPDGSTIATLQSDNSVKLVPIQNPPGRILAVAALIWLVLVAIPWLGLRLVARLRRA